MSTNGCSGFFLFYLKLELFSKIKKDLAFTHSKKKTGLSISQDLNNPEHSFVYIGKHEMCGKVQQKIINSMLVAARQSFHFSDK